MQQAFLHLQVGIACLLLQAGPIGAMHKTQTEIVHLLQTVVTCDKQQCCQRYVPNPQLSIGKI